jgi:hypothetical protein
MDVNLQLRILCTLNFPSNTLSCVKKQNKTIQLECTVRRFLRFLRIL